MENIKTFYETYADRITEKRVKSPYKLRRYAHMQQYNSVLRFVEEGMHVLDAGCGEGTLSFMMAAKGARVTGIDLSVPNIEECQRQAGEMGIPNVEFLTGDLEHLPFPDGAFDLVVSSHVLEHLPDFDAGLAEIMRVSKGKAVVAIPTICNLCSLVQVGHGWFFLKGPRSFAGLFVGMARFLRAVATGAEGVDEGYVGTDAPHVFRFPTVLRRKARALGYQVTYYEASTLCAPYFESLLPVVRFLDRFRGKPFFRNLGYGTTYVVETTSRR